MRLGVRAVFCLLAIVFVGSGCRKALTPNIDRNQAPETYITAAPFDTVTIRGPDGRPQFPPINIADHTIPVRFHMYWAGADKDGAVVGFYWAVTETTVAPIGADFAPLPGPKPSDYHFTTKTDSFFVFNVAQNVRDRLHAFYIYAVDDKGKADPTPAHFTFISLDNYPPQPVITMSTGTDTIVHVDFNGVITREVITVPVSDTLPPPARTYPPTDTVPARSVLNFRWFSNLRIAGSNVIGYSYKLDEPAFVSVDSSVHAVTYNSGVPDPVTHRLNGPIAPGTKVFTLRAEDEAGGAGLTTRRFVMNYSPDTWWAGPDPGLPAFQQVSDNVISGWHDGKAVTVNNFVGWQGIAGTWMSSDSVTFRPPQRPPRKTFLEIWKDKIWVRSEYDTVHMNSWVALWSGGYDKDSPYTVRTDPLDPSLPNPLGAVLTGDGRIGSPIGFRSLVIVATDPSGSPTSPPTSGLYPIYEPASVFRAPHLAAYWLMNFSGKAYALVQAEDADGGRDRTVTDPVGLVRDVDNGSPTPAEVTLRPKVLVFYVNKAPVFNNIATMRPRADGTWGAVAGKSLDSFSACAWLMNLPAYDVDPLKKSDSPAPGGPSPTSTFSLSLMFTAPTLAGPDTTWTLDVPTYSFATTNFTVNAPPNVASGLVTMIQTLCDCTQCSDNPGNGRCVPYTVHFQYTRPGTGCFEPAGISDDTSTRPGTGSPYRSQ